MKKLILLVLFLGVAFSNYAQNKNEKAVIDVDGVCMMCKARIEKASIKVKGVKSAVWNVDTHELALIYDARKTDINAIQVSVAEVGHDTKDVKATLEQYNSVHDCCRYRNETVIEEHKEGGE